MLLTYERYYKRYGTRRIANFIEPIIIDSRSFEFPMNSMLYEFKVSDINTPLTKVGYLKNTDKVFVRTIMEYNDEETVGSVTKLQKSEATILTELANSEKQFKFLRSTITNINMNNRSLLVLNYGAVSYFYRYGNNPLNRYYKWVNTFNKASSQLQQDKYRTDRNRFFVMNMPNQLPSRQELDRYSKHITTPMLEKLPNYSYFNLVELWRYLTPELRNESFLAKIPKEELSNTTLMLVIDTKVVLINLKVLTGIVKEYELDSEIAKYKALTVRKLLYVMLYRIITTPSIPMDVINNENTVAKPDLVIKGFSDTSNLSDDSIDIDNLITSEVKEKIDINTPKATLNNKDITIKPKSVNSVDTVDEIITDEEEIDEDAAGFEIEHVMATNDQLTYTSLEDIKSEIPDPVSRLSKDIDTLLEYSMISKKEAADIKNILAEQPNKKSPFTEDSRKVGELLDLTTDETVVDAKDISITDNISVLDKKQNRDVLNSIDAKYLSKQFHKDITRVVYGIQNSSSIVEDYTVNATESILGKIEEHNIVIRTLNGRPSKIKMILPKIEEDGSFKISNNQYRIRKQRADLPIRKIDSNIVSLSSYYGKLFITKANVKKDDVGYWLRNQILSKYETDPNLKDVVFLPSDNKDTKLPIIYSYFSRYMKSFRYKNITFNFNYDERKKLFKELSDKEISKIENNNVIIIGIKGTNPIVMDFKNRLFEYNNNSFTELPDMYTMLEINTSKMPVEHSVIKLYKKNIPTGLLLAYYLGLDTLLRLLKVRFEIFTFTAKINVPYKDYYVIQFADVKYVIERDNDLNDLILYGLTTLKDLTKTVKSKLFNSRDGMTVIFNKLDYSILYINEIKLLETMFVDPITLTLLKELKEPTTFKGLLIRANELLVDDNYTHPNNITEMTIKGYERIAGMMYKELVTSIKEHENRSVFGRSKLLVNPFKIINKINEDSTTVLIDDLNPIAMLKQTEDITYLGEGGRGKDSMNRDTRAMHESEIGVLSEASKDSGDVGISAYTSAAPKIKDIRGSIGNFDFKEDGWAAILSTSAMLAPFATNDDVKRLKEIGPVT